MSGALIQLYEVGATGYGSAAKPIVLSPVTTDALGSFSLTNQYTCDPGTYVYITASGGNPGSGPNANLALMAALGSCSNLKANAATTFIWMNEVTTVAAAYALGQFSAGTSFGTALQAKPGVGGVTPPADNFATSATNIQGVANAMAIAAVLANNTVGTSPGTNLNGTATVESYTINTIADILSTCVNSVGGVAGDNSACGKVFAATTPSGGAAPADTIQAALEFALHPGDAALLAGTPSGSTLDALIGAQPPYQPYVNTTITGNTINDWTVAISYVPVNPTSKATLLANSNQVAIDQFGNAWITNNGTGHPVVELTPNGDPIQAGSTAGVYNVTSYNVGGTATPIGTGAGLPDSTSHLYGIGLDTSSNAFATDYNSGNFFRIGASGAAIGTTGESTSVANGGGGVAATSMFAGSTGAHPTGVAFDGNDNLYGLLYGNGGTSPGPTGAGCANPTTPYTTGTKNIVSFFKSGGNYGAIQFGSPAGSNMANIAVDAGAQDLAGGTPIPGSPFVWFAAEASGGTENHGTSGHYSYLYQAFTANTTANGTTVATSAGCNTPLGSISSASGGSATTQIATNANGGDAQDVFNNIYAVAFDHANNLWTANSAPADANNAETSSVTKLTPAYTVATSSTTTNFNASFTFAQYTNGGLLASGFKPLQVAIDGSGSAFMPNDGTKANLAAVTNSGAAIAPANGFTGATYSADGLTTEVARPSSTSAGAAVDPSGNLWVTSGAATIAVVGPPAIASVPATNVLQIVGLAVPVQTPLSVAAKNNLLGAKP